MGSRSSSSSGTRILESGGMSSRVSAHDAVNSARRGATSGAGGHRQKRNIESAEAASPSTTATELEDRQREREQHPQQANEIDRLIPPERLQVMVSAEPHHLAHVGQTDPHSHHLSNNHQDEQALKREKTSREDDERPLIELAKPGVRKWSQCSGASQVSTSFGCSLGGSSSALDASESRRTSSIGAGLNQLQRQDCRLLATGRKSSSIVDCFQSVAREPGGGGGLSRDSPAELIGSPGRHANSHQAAPMRRTISQSMLELDESHLGPGDKFQIYWRELAFGYTPTSTIARLGSKLPLGSLARNQQLVLRHVSGSFRSNQLVAIIGPSGCGKTTLLQFLAGTNKHQRERLRIGGLSEPKVAYIGQDDCLLPGLTARETLMYASRLQNGRRDFDHAHHIEPILKELGLAECAERNVTKLSGGQAKRVTIGQQLLYPTNLLILDEVTSGLDASTSYSIVKLLKYLVSDQRYPMSIVMSIHQPSARLFAVFDHLYVMSDGCCLYEGGCHLDQINERLARFGLACPPYHNMADYLIELACASPEDGGRRVSKSGAPVGETDGPERVRLQMIEHQRQLHADEAQHGRGNMSSEVATTDHSLFSAVELARQRRPRPVMHHFRTHLWRSLLRIRRSYILTYLQLATYIVLGLQLATFYGPDIGQLGGCPRLPGNLMSYVLSSASDQQQEQEGDNSTLEVRRIQENMNFLLVAVMLATFAALEITVITFPMEAKTVRREWSNGWYSVSSYFAGRTLADLPFQLVFVSLFCLLVYQMTGQLGLASWRFGSFVAIIMMTALAAQSFGFMFGAIFMNNLPAAVFTAPIAIFPALLFSGFFSRVSQIPHFYKPMTYISHFRYAFDGLLVTLYGFDRCQCQQSALDGYHLGMRNQTSSMRDMFSYLFGASDCAPSIEEGQPLATSGATSPAADIAQDDLSAIQASNSTLAAQLFRSIVENAPEASTAAPARPHPASSAEFMRPIEDALVDSLLERMNSSAAAGQLTNGTGEDSADGESVFDRLATRFAQRLTRLLNKQANFGKEMPRNCTQFNSYLMTEFELRDDDLLVGLLMLFIMVLVTRILCNCLLNYTIASNRAK